MREASRIWHIFVRFISFALVLRAISKMLVVAGLFWMQCNVVFDMCISTELVLNFFSIYGLHVGH